MKLLVVGNGGREHAIVWKLRQSKRAGEIYCTVGNAGIDSIAVPIGIKPDDIDALAGFAGDKGIGLTVVGPEVPLAAGIVDVFTKQGLMIFGPTAAAARLETSKAFAKEFMSRHDIPTARFEKYNITEKQKALANLESARYPIVVKADGLAAGKGVVICGDKKEASSALADMFDSRIFGLAGETVVVEEFLKGSEASVFAVTDGTDYVVLPPAQDHKRILDGEKGKNTGGMGSFAPAGLVVDESTMKKVRERIIEPVLKGMAEEGNPFRGCLYCGLMIDENHDPHVVEFNVRFGDPETQAVLPLIGSDFLELLEASSEGKIKGHELRTAGGNCCCVVLASGGYPDKYEAGKDITGLDSITDDCIVFHAGTKRSADGKVITAGGRVLNVVGLGENLADAVASAYSNAELIEFENKYFRKDIGRKGLK